MGPNSNISPIILFAYNRDKHLEQTLKHLSANYLADQSELFVFSDGPKSESDLPKVERVRKLIRNISGFKSLHIVEQKENHGLSRSIISGVTEIVHCYGKVIVLEDDIVTSKYFLKYMNDALNLYENNERVFSTHGYTYPMTGLLPTTFFLKITGCWGWGTWRRAWSCFEEDGAKLLSMIRKTNSENTFDIDGSYGFTRMLEDQVAGKNNSWAIRWQASVFLQNGLTLYSGTSLTNNIGLDGSGTHCNETAGFTCTLSETEVLVEAIPCVEDLTARKSLEKYFRSLQPGIFKRVMNKVGNIWKSKAGKKLLHG